MTNKITHYQQPAIAPRPTAQHLNTIEPSQAEMIRAITGAIAQRIEQPSITLQQHHHHYQQPEVQQPQVVHHVHHSASGLDEALKYLVVAVSLLFIGCFAVVAVNEAFHSSAAPVEEIG